MSALAPCLACHRHVQPDAESCPFCGASAPPRARARVLPSGATRAVICAIGVAALGAAGCDSSSTADAGETVADAGIDSGNVAMPYGAPPADHLV